MTTTSYDAAATARGVSKYWWVFLIAGVLWLIMSLIVFRMELGTVYAISILFGIIAIAAGIDEFISLGAVHGGWKWLHGILGVIFVDRGHRRVREPQLDVPRARLDHRLVVPLQGHLRRHHRVCPEARARSLVGSAHRRRDRARARVLGRR